MKGQFIFDFIPIIPLQYINLSGYQRLFYLVKIMRFVNGLRIFSVPAIMEKVKMFYKEKLNKVIKDNPILADNIEIDNNNITTLIIIGFIFRTIKLIIIIINISYFIGFIWYIFCELVIDINAY